MRTKSTNFCLVLGLAAASVAVVAAQESCPTTWQCKPVGSTPPVLDADLSDWADVDAFNSGLVSITGTEYDGGDVSYKCQYDENNIYFAFEIPGEYRFSADSNHLCAAFGTMFKIGESATLMNMGGCPEAMGGCADGIPEVCDAYRVDLGVHWELSGTQQNTFYDVSEGGTGNDPIANKDDEYGVSPYCKFDDDDSAAANEWAGAWAHTDPTEGTFGTYIFEMSRKLTTASPMTDAQLTPGETIQLGVAFWDPYENSESGWSDSGHYVTGCGFRWIDLELVSADEASTTGGDVTSGADGNMDSTPAGTSESTATGACPTTWQCKPIGSSAPTLDADLSDWADIEAYTTGLVSITGIDYDGGDVTYKCQYDEDTIYFAFDIPGDYRFSADSNHLCAAIGTMFKIGESATFMNMGGCPDAMGGCADGVPESCDAYRVDLGAHWELAGTQQNTFYDVSESVAANQQGSMMTNGTGNDLIANKDDEYGVSPYCKFDDDDVAADNEWAGAWAHSNPTEGAFGSYMFEMSRKLKTASTMTDAQLTPGETIQFGVAFWDPNESAESGWTDPGHYVTGCGNKWIDLELVSGDGASTTGADTTSNASMTGGEDAPAEAVSACPTTWQCRPVANSAPVLDAELSDWADVEAYTSGIVSILGVDYDAGDVSYKCQHDENNIYFAFEIPGDYRFSADSNHLCAAIGTMFKIGESATYLNMGGCPDAMGGCADGVPESCDAYRVDIGAHWELKGTERNTFYDVSEGGTGDDLIANKDDEYGVSPYCKFDDDDSAAANEWAGAWTHTNPTEGEFGTYIFEMSRLLKTASLKTDAQLTPGETIQFGVAFWDPNESVESGWTDPGHYVTGCGNKWIDLELVTSVMEVTKIEEDAAATKTEEVAANGEKTPSTSSDSTTSQSSTAQTTVAGATSGAVTATRHLFLTLIVLSSLFGL